MLRFRIDNNSIRTVQQNIADVMHKKALDGAEAVYAEAQQGQLYKDIMSRTPGDTGTLRSSYVVLRSLDTLASRYRIGLAFGSPANDPVNWKYGAPVSEYAIKVHELPRSQWNIPTPIAHDYRKMGEFTERPLHDSQFYLRIPVHDFASRMLGLLAQIMRS